MESSCQNKKFQSNMLSAGGVGYGGAELEKKSSPMNPYYRFICMTHSKFANVNNDDDNNNDCDGNDGVSDVILPEFEHLFTNICLTDSCSCCLREASNKKLLISKQHDYCKEDWMRKMAYRKIKTKIENAIRRHKVFLIRGELPKLKEALEARGWVQKYEPARTRSLPYGVAVNLEAHSLGDLMQADGKLNEKAVIFALLRRRQPDFIWDCRNDFVEWRRGLGCNVLLNKYQRSFLYTSKLGMARSLKEAYWLHEENVSSVLFPRSYDPSAERRAFLDDFRLTAAASLLKWFAHVMTTSEEVLVIGPTERRTIPISRLDFAVERCQEFIDIAMHEDLDAEQREKQLSDEEWDSFLNDYTAVMHQGAGIDGSPDDSQEQLQRCFLTTIVTLEKLKTVDPQYKMSGMRGIWILKPSHLCCGNGIVISHNVKEILRKVEEKPKDYYIVQKYIERPLLIKQTKFDIRLWYLVTCSYPLTIWVFKDVLFRFSSKPYTFSTYHEAIHICNTAVQEKYDDEKRRRERRKQYSGLPKEPADPKSLRDQGWNCDKLNEYLKSKGHKGEPYYDLIYPKMAEAVVLMMLAAQDHMERRRCSFELYGADFVLAEDMSVWLIEINTNPRMHPPSSRWTRRLYSDVLESLVKVIMDVPIDSSADTGGFTLAYKQNVADFQPYIGPCLLVAGKSMTLHEPSRRKPEKERRANICGPWSRQRRARTAPPMVLRSRDPNMVDLIDHLKAIQCTAAN